MDTAIAAMECYRSLSSKIDRACIPIHKILKCKTPVLFGKSCIGEYTGLFGENSPFFGHFVGFHSLLIPIVLRFFGIVFPCDHEVVQNSRSPFQRRLLRIQLPKDLVVVYFHSVVHFPGWLDCFDLVMSRTNMPRR